MTRRCHILGVAALLISSIAWAAESLNWTFSIDSPIQFDDAQVALSNNQVVLKLLNQADNSQKNFDAGTFANSMWDGVNQLLVVKSPITLPDNAAQNPVLLHADTAAQFSGNKQAHVNSGDPSIVPSCTASACPTLDAAGKIGTALWFNGKDDFLVAPGTWGGADWTEATIEAWIRVDGKTNTADAMQAIVSSTSANMFVHFQMLASGDKFNAAIYANASSKVVDFDGAAAPLALGAWHHVAVSIKSGDISLYADGIKVGSSSFTFASLAPIVVGQELRIGSGYGKGRFFKGTMDEVAIYKRALSADDIKSHFNMQSAGLGSSFNSRIFAVGSPVAWTDLTWIPAGPNGVQLPDNATTDSGYVAGNVNMSGNVLLAHLNEASGTEFADSSGKTNKGSCAGAGCPTMGGDGKFATAAEFDGIDDQISISSSPSVNVTSAVTVEAWIYPKAMPNFSEGAGIVSKGNNGNDARYELLTVATLPVGANAAFFRLTNHGTVDPVDGVTKPYIYGGNMPLNAWSHVVGSYDGSVMSLYVNGIQVASQPATGGSITTDNNPLFIGVRQNQSGSTGKSHFKGKIDEVAVYGRALAPDEVLSRYLRGALQPKFQVRSCEKADCAGEKFVGPGNSQSTYYTPSALVSIPQQKVVLTGVKSNSYFQYRVILESQSANLFPALKSVVVGPEHYPSTSPVVTVPTNVDFAVLENFADEMGAANKGEVRYQLSPDGNTWYFCYGTQWQKTTDPLVMVIPELGELQKTNSAEKISQCAPTFASAAGTGKIFFRAFLHSPGATEPVALKSVKVGYSKTPPAEPPPPPPSTIVLSDIPTISINEGGKLSLTLDASKSGLTGPFQYMCQANCPEGMSIGSTNGEINWTPSYAQAGKYSNIQFKVIDAVKKEATQLLSVVVSDANAMPKITNPGDKVVTAGQNTSFTIAAQDADGGAPTYSIASGKQDGMELNASTGYFSWTPKPEQAGAYAVMLRAVDDKDPQSFSDQAVIIVVNKLIADTPEESTQPQTLPEPTSTTQAQPAALAEPAAATVATGSGCSLIR
jgi:hypothetical protein